MNPPPVAYVTTALIEMLEDATSLEVGDSGAPLDATKPYGIVDPIPGGGPDGDAANPDGTLYRIVQVTSVGATRLQAEAARDRFHSAILATNPSGFQHPIDAFTLPGNAPSTLTAAGLAVIGRSHVESGGVDYEGLLFNAHERYELWLAPA